MQKCRYYEIEAIEIPIVYNKYGDYDPNGLLYVLKKDADREGVYSFQDMGDTRSGEEGTNIHGLFGAIAVEEAGATFHDTRTGKKINYGTKAVIKRPDGSSFREFTLFVHDFALLFDKDGKALNPSEVPGSHDDPGVMGINYRCEPMRERLKNHSDPAYVFSSFVHGDPATPILETYPSEELMIRLLDGAHEEQHAFNLTGMNWKREVSDPSSPDVAAQTLGISEAFNIHVTKQYAPGDYLYYFGGIDDAWLGLWGIIRVYGHSKRHLKSLCSATGQRKIFYNHHGDHDPDGLMFVPLEEADKVLSEKYEPKPLILRANAGERKGLINSKDI
ncbi:MAG: hypothetical protein MRZ49_00575 [Lachnospiraceae bacterium]|nr:hypothetical protein [Lachnospiraceae bacterium]